ncbi:MAG: ATP-binding protein [Thermoanaerobaculia bacterium]
MTIRYAPKLRLAPLWPAVAAIGVTALLAALFLPRALHDTARRELAEEAHLLSSAIAWPAPMAPAITDGSLQRQIERLASGTHYRLTLVAPDGKVVADSSRSAGDVARMDNHANRPEIAEAFSRGQGTSSRHSVTTGVDTIYAARLVQDAEGGRWIFRLARPLATVDAMTSAMARILLLSALAALALVALVSWWLTRSLFTPLARLIAAADDMGHGDYRAEFVIPEQSELARLGLALRHIAGRARAQIDAVAAERDHLRATVAGMTEGVLVTDAEGHVQLANAAYGDLFDVAPGAAAADVLDLAREPEVGLLIGRTLAGEGEQRAEIERATPRRRTLAVVASPLAAGKGAVVVARDITETERLHRMRRDFVANVSHELKTPLAAIRGYAETLTDGAAAEAETALRFSRRILDQCRRLGALLEDLLTLSRLESTEAPPVGDPVDLRELASEAVELLTPTAEAKQVTLVIEEGPSPTVPGDADGILRLISNLVDNAIKYNRPEGTVRLRLAAEGANAVLTVEDSGIGIPSSSLPRIFERFYRVDKGRSREEGGTGLGLAIVKHVAQSHGGKVEVESRIGEGTRFRVQLPLAGR